LPHGYANEMLMRRQCVAPRQLKVSRARGGAAGWRKAAECRSVLPGAAGEDFPVVPAAQHVPPPPPPPRTTNARRVYEPLVPPHSLPINAADARGRGDAALLQSARTFWIDLFFFCLFRQFNLPAQQVRAFLTATSSLLPL